MPPTSVGIDPLSARSLFLEITAEDKEVGSATGFIVKHVEMQYLITNKHVVETNNPDEIVISHHAKGRLGAWVKRTEHLLAENGTPLWIEHHDSSIDVIALPLRSIEGIDLYPFDLSLANVDLIVEPAMPVSIIGYIAGLSQPGQWPIWKTGHVATDFELEYNELPAFLVDATNRGGMSGSPVVVRMWGGFRTKNSGAILSSSFPTTRFLGIYSGTPYDTSEIGQVCRPHIIQELLDLKSH
jgi:hypothetical protein